MKRLLILMVLLLPLIAAEPSFLLKLDTHYYKSGQEILVYNENLSFDGISLDVIGINRDNASRIVDMQIVKVSPELEGKFSNKTKTLILKEERILWTSSFIDTTNFKNDSVLLYIGVEGVNEALGQKFYNEIQLFVNKENVVALNNPEESEDIIKQIGQWIYRGNWQIGLMIGIGIIILLIWVIWWQRIGNKMERWRDRKKHEQ